jgi:hypothetical protein
VVASRLYCWWDWQELEATLARVRVDRGGEP